MVLIALAIAPGLAICLYIFHRDAYNREPKRNLLLAFILGAVMIIPAALTEQLLMPAFSNSVTGVAATAFLVVALTEELVKFIVLRFYALRRKSFDEPLDGIVYSVVISMGFATLENIFYVQQYGMATAWLRMFLAVPAHASFAVVMGYYAGRAKFEPGANTGLLLRGLLIATFFHGLYDFFLFLQGNPNVKDYVSDILLFAGAVGSFIVGVRLSLRHIRIHRKLSRQTHRPLESLSVRRAYPNDIPLIRDLTMRIWPVTYGGILTPAQIDYMLDMMYDEAVLRRQMEKEQEFVIVYDGLEAVGFAAFGQVSPGVFKLHKIYVLPSQQGKGTGKFVITQLADAMRRKNGRIMRLNVNRENKAIGFYQKIGFVITGEEDNDIGSGYFMNDYVMELPLTL
ncbi:MAG: GNAT family N-acetyltransferase [Chitinophagaceae bacterium]|nr:MAG: GNAT family N-acetyltransferase [Chitinophagaceae bacterium]